MTADTAPADTADAADTDDAVSARLREAWTSVDKGDNAAALAQLQAVVADFPDAADAVHDLGLLQLANGDVAAAIASFERSLALDHGRDDAYYNLGVAYEQQGRPEEAVDAYVAALERNPQFLEPGMRLGGLFERAGDAARAASAYARIGSALAQAGDIEKAVTALGAAVRVDPQSVPALHALGGALLRAGHLPQARTMLERAAKLAPTAAEIHNTLGLVCYHQGALDDAIRCFETALRHRTVFAQARNNLGNCHARLGHHREAVRQYRFAANQFPNYADAHLNAAQELHMLGRLDEAETACARVLEIRPDDALAHTTLAWLLLARGAFTRGWREFEWRVSAAHGRYLPDPREPGRHLPRPSELMPIDFTGRRVLLLGTGGLGTELFFLRFLDMLRARGCTWIGYRTDPRLAAILHPAGLVDAVLDEHDEVPDGVELIFSGCELPLVLGHGDGDASPPPLRLTPSQRARETIGARLRALADEPLLALTWRAGLHGDGPRRKRVAVDALARALAPWPGALVSVQRDAEPGELDELTRLCGRPVHDFGDVNDDLDLALALFERTAEYIGVSNTNMYLAAAVGAAARVLVKRPGEWRWAGDDDTHSRWFPDFRLYAEDPRQGWGPALARLRRELDAA